MPKRSVFNSKPEVLLSRPQRNTKAKVVFDPSDNYIPKKKRSELSEKLSTSNAKESIAKKIVTNNMKNKSSVQSRRTTVNGFNEDNKNEYIDDNLVSTEACLICKKDVKTSNNLVDCRICLHGVHRECLLVEEPMWKWKLDKCIFLCQICRQTRCSECTQPESNLETFISCLICKVGLHLKCYEEYDIKPMHTIQPGSYLCIPCLTLATDRIPELEDDDDLPENLNPGICTISDKADNENDEDDSKSLSSFKSFNNDENFSPFNKDKNDIPNVFNWSKERVFNYFLRHVPEKVAKVIIEEDIDGGVIFLFQRSDLNKLKLNVGMKMKFYRMVRILQTRNSSPAIYWE